MTFAEKKPRGPHPLPGAKVGDPWGEVVGRLLAPRDVARRLGLSTSRVIQLDREGVLLALRDASGRRFYDAAVVEAFARAREVRESLD